MSSINCKQTPTKICKSSVPLDISSCRLCNAVGDRLWSKNLFVKKNCALLAVAQDIRGHTLKQDDSLLPHLICRPCERWINNFVTFKTFIIERQKLFERVKRCTEMSPSVPRTLLKKSTNESEERSRCGLLYSSAQQQNTMEKEVNLQDAGKELLDIFTTDNLQYDEVQFQVNHVFLEFEFFVLYSSLLDKFYL